ncbi:glycosyltransferase family 87 protein [Halomicroarcula sp. GCM10025709]|uniref:glycosyltransferase family 87 protein n=1 Tax=Haloarcula TaxID=2237 RepID=UPI0024C287A9|nr:glycosyltransferase family 87 protein [Halomicroarcula sp. YJ-61-S]
MSTAARLWSLRRRRPVFVVVVAITALSLFVYPLVDWWLRSIEVAPKFVYWDFGAFSGAVDRWEAGKSLYVQNEDGGYHGSYLYPPLVVVLFVPFTELGAEAATAWNIASVAFLWFSLQALVTGLGYRLRWWESSLMLPLLVGFQPLLISLKLGQMAPFMAGLLTLSAAVMVQSDGRLKQGVSGAATAVVGLVKFAYAPVGAHLLRSRTRLLGAVTAGVVFVGASVLLVGVEAHRTYIDVLAWGVGQGGGTRPPTLWLPPYYRPIHWLPGAQALRLLGSFAIIAVAGLTDWGSDRTLFALGVSAFALLTPLPYTYYFVALLPAVVLLVDEELTADGYPALPVLGLLCVHLHAYGLNFLANHLPSMLPPVQVLRPYFVLQPGLWGTLLLVGTATLQVARDAERPDALRTGAEEPESASTDD